jgi:hypothetical protein
VEHRWLRAGRVLGGLDWRRYRGPSARAKNAQAWALRAWMEMVRLSLLLPPSCSVGWVLPAVAAERAPRSLTGISVCIVMIGTAKRLRKVGLSAIQSSQLRASLYVFWRPELTAIHALRNDHPSAGTHSNSSMTINLVCAVWANCADIIIQP